MGNGRYQDVVSRVGDVVDADGIAGQRDDRFQQPEARRQIVPGANQLVERPRNWERDQVAPRQRAGRQEVEPAGLTRREVVREACRRRGEDGGRCGDDEECSKDRNQARGARVAVRALRC